MGLLIAYVLGILTGIKRNDPVHKSNQLSEKSIKPLPVPSPNLYIQAALETQSKPKDSKKNGLEIYLAVIHTLTMVAVVWYAVINSHMLERMKESTYAAQKAANTAEKQLEMSERPWIEIIDVEPWGSNVPVVGGLSFHKALPNSLGIEANATIQVKMSFKNIGHSVADVSTNVELFMPQFSSTEYWNRVSAEEKRFCESPDMSAVTSQKLTVFPDEPQSFDWYGGITAPIHPQSINRFPDGSSGIVPALIVCVSYRQKGLPSLYQTRAVYEVSHPGEYSRFFSIGRCNLTPIQNTPMTWCEGGGKMLKLDRNFMGDEAY